MREDSSGHLEDFAEAASAQHSQQQVALCQHWVVPEPACLLLLQPLQVPGNPPSLTFCTPGNWSFKTSEIDMAEKPKLADFTSVLMLRKPRSLIPSFMSWQLFRWVCKDQWASDKRSQQRWQRDSLDMASLLCLKALLLLIQGILFPLQGSHSHLHTHSLVFQYHFPRQFFLLR